MKRYLLKFCMVFFITVTHLNSFSQELLNSAIKEEINRNLEVLSKEKIPAYYISVSVEKKIQHQINYVFGAVMNDMVDSVRMGKVTVRVGNKKFDNTHYIQENTRTFLVPVNEDEKFVKQKIWRSVYDSYQAAINQYTLAKTRKKSITIDDDSSADFSIEKPVVYNEMPVDFNLVDDNPLIKNALQKLGQVFYQNKEIMSNSVFFSATLTRIVFVDSDGSDIVQNQQSARIGAMATVYASDGMNLPLYQTYYASAASGLPNEDSLMKDINALSNNLILLQKAPLVDGYSGPILLDASATGVFFHEFLGHRLEASRAKNISDSKTLKAKIGEQLLPKDISVTFDPTISVYGNMVLSGGYKVDDEGVFGKKVVTIKDGVLHDFLMCRTPVEGHRISNGHGRGEFYRATESRQSNMIIESTSPESFAKLREALIKEIKAQNKIYGYYIKEVSGGFTINYTGAPNAFTLIPLLTYKVYADGRPDELVRGVDLIGTPLNAFMQIIACGNDQKVFNGICGAVSGQVPVAAVAPSILLKNIETQRKQNNQVKLPILPRP